MDYLIIGDSGCEINATLKTRLPFIHVPLTLQVLGETLIDDATLNLNYFLSQMRKSPDLPKTASPSPMDFMQHFDKAEHIFIVTLSRHLSSTYQSALLARKIYLDEHPNKFIAVIDSLSASVGETMVAYKIKQAVDAGFSPQEVVEQACRYRDQMKTLFVLHNIDNLKKSGRISHLSGLLATLLHIKPVLASDGKGKIKLIEKVRGEKRALKRLLDIMSADSNYAPDHKPLAIAHCNCLQRAQWLKNEISKRYACQEIFIVDMRGTISVYADDGGVLLAF